MAGQGCCSPTPQPPRPLPCCPGAPALPSSHLKSGKATSCRGICRKKSGLWHLGFPVTIFLFRSQSPSQASWQLQLKGLARRFLEDVGHVTRKMPRWSQLSVMALPYPAHPGHPVPNTPSQTAHNYKRQHPSMAGPVFHKPRGLKHPLSPLR